MNMLETTPLIGSDEAKGLAEDLTRLISHRATTHPKIVAEKALGLLNILDAEKLITYADILNGTCFYLFEIGQSNLGILLGKRISERALEFENIQVRRRISNILGGQFCDIADYSSAMEYLEVAVALARRIGDATIEAACLGNVIAVMEEMGHYRQAISMATRVLELKDCTKAANTVKLQCASIGLFAAHRIGDAASAAIFLSQGQNILCFHTEPLQKAFFEKARALYLVDIGESLNAREHLNKAILDIGSLGSFRINTLLRVAYAVCDWSQGDGDKAKEVLEKLHVESKQQRIYHNFVLQALIKVYSDARTPVEASAGLSYARELVEYTTSVKKAKFYRQLASKRDAQDQRCAALLTTTMVDPFSLAKDWLLASDILAPIVEGQDSGERKALTKHEELTVIHDDMAKLRAATLRRDIKTDAVDTAENWAIAAEFFDDETGQHCYRVGHLAAMLAREIGLDEAFCVQVEHAARLHDIGKIAVNEVILLKPGPLDASEMAAMRLHTEVGAQILSGSDDPTLMMAVEVARHHHEWWNGRGYPAGLAGTNIPISARVCAFADVYDALTHARSYKKAWDHDRALAEIVRLSGTQFDPEMIGPFCKVLNGYRTDLGKNAIPGFIDMNSNALIASRKKLMETISGSSTVNAMVA